MSNDVGFRFASVQSMVGEGDVSDVGVVDNSGLVSWDSEHATCTSPSAFSRHDVPAPFASERPNHGGPNFEADLIATAGVAARATRYPQQIEAMEVGQIWQFADSAETHRVFYFNGSHTVEEHIVSRNSRIRTIDKEGTGNTGVPKVLIETVGDEASVSGWLELSTPMSLVPTT